MTEETLLYFELYRKKLQELEDNKLIGANLRDNLMVVQEKSNTLLSEIDQMQRLITYMIDNDIDLVEAKLKTDDNDRQRNHWQNMMQDSYTTIGVLGPNKNLLATGSMNGNTGIRDITSSIMSNISTITKRI